jgi:hypothetical protein
MFTNQLPVLTVGTRAATAEATVNGANQNVDYASVAKAGTSNGLHMTQTLDFEQRRRQDVQGRRSVHLSQASSLTTTASKPRSRRPGCSSLPSSAMRLRLPVPSP